MLAMKLAPVIVLPIKVPPPIPMLKEPEKIDIATGAAELGTFLINSAWKVTLNKVAIMPIKMQAAVIVMKLLAATCHSINGIKRPSKLLRMIR